MIKAKLTLKALRTLYGLTQAQAAQLIGVSKDAWYGYENLKFHPSKVKLQRISEVFHISIDDIIFEKHIRLSRSIEVKE